MFCPSILPELDFLSSKLPCLFPVIISTTTRGLWNSNVNTQQHLMIPSGPYHYRLYSAFVVCEVLKRMTSVHLCPSRATGVYIRLFSQLCHFLMLSLPLINTLLTLYGQSVLIIMSISGSHSHSKPMGADIECTAFRFQPLLFVAPVESIADLNAALASVYVTTHNCAHWNVSVVMLLVWCYFCPLPCRCSLICLTNQCHYCQPATCRNSHVWKIAIIGFALFS